jgi:hypothetical protein
MVGPHLSAACHTDALHVEKDSWSLTDWLTCRPPGFLSKKFSAAQHNYWTHEHETIAILEALLTWEDKLLGRAFTLVMDNKGLEYFQTQQSLSA